jgi:hypothetical protein
MAEGTHPISGADPGPSSLYPPKVRGVDSNFDSTESIHQARLRHGRLQFAGGSIAAAHLQDHRLKNAGKNRIRKLNNQP